MFTKRPKAVSCHICGQQYGTASIGIHVPQCENKWNEKEKWKPVRERRPVPSKPQEFDSKLSGLKDGSYSIDQFNEDSYQNFKNKALVPCGCGRTFLPDSLPKHQKGCKLAHLTPQQNYGPGPSSFKEGGGMGVFGGKTRVPGALRPKALMCYICGREFGTASLEIHIPQCQKKWELVQLQLAPKDRRKCPEAPKMMAEMPDLGDLPIKARGSAMQQYNDEAFNQFNTKALVPCEMCGRTFLPDSLKKHIKGCRPKAAKFDDSQASTSLESPVKVLLKKDVQFTLNPRPTNQLDQNYKDINSEVALMPCGNCARTFLPESLKRHEKGCRAVSSLKQNYSAANINPYNESISLAENQRSESNVGNYGEGAQSKLIPRSSSIVLQGRRLISDSPSRTLDATRLPTLPILSKESPYYSPQSISIKVKAQGLSNSASGIGNSRPGGLETCNECGREFKSFLLVNHQKLCNK